ncbi:unnamed protein product [Rotaria magnacalcarata]|uniref:EGF-like domain-containing protein n=1 Tax=Rotaria magnacalcarata TaxID=392030 RepID=A0A819UDQ3_9BILA|nr:unnamed protein product [Rotaria magnacalcarata]
MGVNCDRSSNLCNITQPCKNNGTCNGNHYSYNCSCPCGFNGTDCEFDHRPCKPYTCLNNGACNETSNSTFVCACLSGWQGVHCESMVNFCDNNSCLNNGVCRPLLENYKCECLGDSYSGPLCQISSAKIIIFKAVSKSFAYISILAIVAVAMFVIMMDMLKYCFGIDPTSGELERIQREKQ